MTALAGTAELLARSVTRSAERRTVIEASPELQERERTKFAAVTDALASALQRRGVTEPAARLLARTGAAIFQTAFERWAEQPEQAALAVRVRETADELAGSLGYGPQRVLPVPVPGRLPWCFVRKHPEIRRAGSACCQIR
jgi:hypothetical protein